MYAFFMLLLAVLAISCASRPASSPNASQPVSSSMPEVQPEPAELFERAIRNVKMDTPLIKKSFEQKTPGILENTGLPVQDIVVKGELFIDGNEFQVIYDCAAASRIGESLFRIPFLLQNATYGTVRSDELLWRPAESEAGLLLSFDDYYWRSWYQYFDMFDAFGAKVTFFVQGLYQQMDLAEFCVQAMERGHDLGFHTANHYDLTKVSRETFDSETIEAADAFFKAGIPLSSLAFPFGFSSPWMREALAPVFPVTRGYGSNIRIYKTETVSNGYIISTAIDNILFPENSKFENDIRLILLAAKFTGNNIVPFTTHEISDSAQWGIMPKRLEYLLKTAQELKLRFYTYNAIQRLFGNPRLP